MSQTQRLGMPLLSAGQAQKELTHNEALVLLDAVLHGCCFGSPANAPPTLPEPGLSYICGAAPVGAWIGQKDGVASWSDSGWRFIKPFDGLQLIARDTGRTWRFMAGQWSAGLVKASEVQVNGLKVVGTQQPAISSISGGNVVDIEARLALTQILAAMRSHGLIASTG